MNFTEAKAKAQFHINKIEEFYRCNNGTQSMIDSQHDAISNLIENHNLPLKRDGWNDKYTWLNDCNIAFEKFGIKVIYNNEGNVQSFFFNGNDTYVASSTIIGNQQDSIIVAILRAREDRKEYLWRRN